MHRGHTSICPTIFEVKEPLKQFTDPAKDFVHSIVPDDKFISSILDNIGAHTLTFPLLERNLTTIDANVMWPLFTGRKNESLRPVLVTVW